jgi:uncharacterized metal-binding protein
MLDRSRAIMDRPCPRPLTSAGTPRNRTAHTPWMALASKLAREAALARCSGSSPVPESGSHPHCRLLASHRARVALGAAVGTILSLVFVARVVAIFALDVNWDELALLQRAVTTARTGDLVGGGRPGLATLLLVPFATACRNAVDTVVQARGLWTAFTVAAALVFWYLLRAVLPPARTRTLALATGVGLWVLAPPFLHASTQVRSDQPAILFGLLGGIALLASRRHLGWAAVAGVSLALGFLSSQKLLYVAALVAVLAAGDLVIQAGWRWRREAWRALIAACAFGAVVVGYRELMVAVSSPPSLVPLGQLSTFEHYSEHVGWLRYRRLLPMLVAQVVVLLCLLPLSLHWARDRSRDGRQLLVAWAVVAAGVAVLLFHAGRFAYFYMVLGLFPAAVGALAIGPTLDRLRTPGRRAGFLTLIWVPMITLAVLQAATLTIPRQQHQRTSLDWVEHTFPPEASGYHDLGAFACRSDPFPVRFGEHHVVDYGPDRREQSIQALISEFRRRPVHFMIEPFDREFPDELREFWSTRYVRYHGTIHVPGRTIRGGPGWMGSFEVIVPGEYVWRADPGEAGPLEVDGLLLDPGALVVFPEPGEHSIRLPVGGGGMLVLALDEPPAPDTNRFFRTF